MCSLASIGYTFSKGVSLSGDGSATMVDSKGGRYALRLNDIILSRDAG